jgi:pyruvate,orthophosphate dikinase
MDQLLHPCLDPATSYSADVVAIGLPASPGAAVGHIVFTAQDAEAHRARGVHPEILDNWTQISTLKFIRKQQS